MAGLDDKCTAATLACVAARFGKVRAGADIGFATPAPAQALRAAHGGVWMTVAADASAHAAAAAVLDPKSVLRLGAGGELPFEDHQFEVVALSTALFSADRARAETLVREAHRILQGGGCLVFTVEAATRGQDGWSSRALFELLRNGFDVIGVHRPPWWRRFGASGRLLTVCARRKNWRNRGMSIVPKAFAAPALAVGLCLIGALAGRADPANAIMRLLNSRASGSHKGYVAAAAEVAEEAKKGRIVYRFVLGVISREPDAPPAARLDDKTREDYLSGARDAITRLAHEKNNSMAWYLLALDKNDPDLLHRAADAGNIQAQNAWGSLILTRVLSESRSTNEIARVLGQSYEYFKKAAGQGDANGLYNLGVCHARGLGTPRDDQSAFNCFRSAAAQGHPEAINNLGWFYREGRAVEKDLELSTRWFAKSAEFENPYGRFNYGLALRRGEGVPKNLAKAAELFRLAAEGGCVEAIDAYGVALWKGEGVKADHDQAFRLFMQAAKAGYPPAMENLSTCYVRGTGVKANEELATEWKVRSNAARGDRNAQAWLRKHGKQ